MNNSDPKKLWSYVNEKLQNKSKNKHIAEIEINNILCDNDKEKANYFNEFFSSAPTKLKSKLVPPQIMHEMSHIPLNLGF